MNVEVVIDDVPDIDQKLVFILIRWSSPHPYTPSHPLPILALPLSNPVMRLTKPHLKGIDAYSYSGIDKSLLSRYVLSPFWTWLVTLFPLTLAPNTITFLGLCFVFANVGTLLYFDPYYTGRELPRWVYASWAAGLFAYQSMDAIDGKQARRTGMSSALGEMFDHGCDAINTTVRCFPCTRYPADGHSWKSSCAPTP